MVWSIPFACQGQVGINTTTPTATLDVNGNLRVRNITEAPTLSQFLVQDTNGNIFWNDGSTLVTNPNFIITNDVPGNTVSIIANTTGYYLQDNILLHSQTVTIPTGSVAVCAIHYQIPIEITNLVDAKMGARLYINGTEQTFLHSRTDNGFLSGTYFLILNQPNTVFEIYGYVEQNIGAVSTQYEFASNRHFNIQILRWD